MSTAREFNFDGLVGPSHNYAGLSFGNVASYNNVNSVSNPKEAALQGLAKMRALAARGFAQALLPPQARPNLRLLRSIGFTGSDADVIARAAREAPVILAGAYSASPMWTANAATVSPSADTADGRAHFTVANLNNKLHRSFEHTQTARTLRALFGDEKHFAVHDALPATPAFGDEGAANHTRLCADHGAPGVEMFVYGRVEFDPEAPVILAGAYSASPMWTANAATVSPSADTADGRAHFTVANLNNKLHRSFEHTQTARTLRALFGDEKHFAVHDALPATPAFGDEGAANHTRLCAEHGAPGVEMFVYGRVEFDPEAPSPRRFPARQTLEASQAVARLHGLDAQRTVFVQQDPETIDQGV
ncbi:N-succinylarginine dihydrolase, partial [Noviherbaspirillum sp.]|uniref:N-succinylarginine dihydrolase n=1 Tax=Noviherbaspirillum sp. TaxID=1926288 RepID=UPI002D4EA2C6